jgi:benzoylformate decarboxylase
VPTVRTIAHALLERHGLTTIFGNPGSNELPFLAGLRDRFDYVLGLHEGAVVGMADGFAQASGRPVLVNLHAASGSGNAMGALTNAVYSRTPLVLTAGQQVRSVIGMEGMLSNVDAAQLMRPLVSHAAEPACAADVPRALAQAIFEATVESRPTYVSIPYDDWDVELDHNAELVLDRTVRVARTPDETHLDWLAREFANAKRPALVLGGDVDAQGLFHRAVALAEHLDAPTWAAPSPFRLPFPNRHRLFRGVLPAGIAPISEALTDHDLVLVLGAPVFRYHQHVPGDYLAATTRLIQVTDESGSATRAPVGEALLADPGAVVEALLERVPPRVAGGAVTDPAWRTPSAPSATGVSGVLHPEEVFATLRDALPDDTAYVVESTSTNQAFWDQMDLRHPGSYYFPASGGLGFGLPAAVGVQMAQPERRVVGIIGDGSANYGITALWTAAQRGVPVTIVILRNGTYGALRWFADLLDVPDAPGMDIPGIDFVRIAEGYGVPAVEVASRDELAAALRGQTPRTDDSDEITQRGPLLIQVDTALTTPS